MGGRRWTPTEIKILREMYINSGGKYKEIVNILNRSKASVLCKIKELKLPRLHKRKKKEKSYIPPIISDIRYYDNWKFIRSYFSQEGRFTKNYTGSYIEDMDEIILNME